MLSPQPLMRQCVLPSLIYLKDLTEYFEDCPNKGLSVLLLFDTVGEVLTLFSLRTYSAVSLGISSEAFLNFLLCVSECLSITCICDVHGIG
jgi:hypothetical protein